MKFEDYNISNKIKEVLTELGLKRPTDIQFKTIQHILKGEDVLAIAQTGTGKTLAFLIPLVELIYTQKQLSRRSDGVKCLIMVPTHELAIQINEVLKSINSKTKLNTLAIYGGVEQEPQIAKLNSGVDILIATPGRMFDLISQGHLRTHRIEILVLDEADHMLDLGFIEDIEDISLKIPKKRQTLFFSATINKKIKKLAYSVVKNAIRIQISPKDPVTKNVKHAVAFVDMDDKRYFLERVIRNNLDSKILVFVRTKVRAQRVLDAMKRVEIEAINIHGDKDQRERNKVMDMFNSGNKNLLIATDVSARGIDFKDIDIVINYDLPEQEENYVHRIGRTGRGKNKGQAISFCAPHEVEILEKIETFINRPIHTIELSKNDYKEIVELKYDHSQNIEAILSEIDDLENRRRKKQKKNKK